YGETVETMAVVLPMFLAAVGEIDPSADGLAAATAAMTAAIAHHGGAKCALDTVLHDLVGKVTGQFVTAFFGLTDPILPTDFPLGLDESDVVAERACRAGRFPALKIKCGGSSDLATFEAVWSVYDGPLCVDANMGWGFDDAIALLSELER